MLSDIDSKRKPLISSTNWEEENSLPGGSIRNITEIHSHGFNHNLERCIQAQDEHWDVGDGGLRAIVFGFSDGLVTNLCLILGVDFGAGNVEHRTIILTGIAGLLAGAFSMAVGEWISMRIQQEANEAQLNLEHKHLQNQTREEVKQLQRILKENGLSQDTCEKIAYDLEKSSISKRL